MSRKKGCRSKGRGTLELHGKSWRARVVIAGKVYTKALGVCSRDEAQRLLDEFTTPLYAKHECDRLERIALMMKRSAGDVEAYNESLPALPLESGYAAFRNTPKGKRSGDATSAVYESQYNRFVDWIKVHYPNVLEVREITRPMAAEFMEEMCDRFSENTHNKYQALLSMMWRALETQDQLIKDRLPEVLSESDAKRLARIKVNPWESVARLSQAGKTTSKRPLTVEEVRKVQESTEGDMAILFDLGIYTGMRFKDCVLLRWEEVDLDIGLIVKMPSKTRNSSGMTVMVALHPDIVASLAAVTRQHDGYVFPEMAEAYARNRGELCKKVNRVFEQCGIERHEEGEHRKKCVVGFHSLRHSFVSMMCGGLGSQANLPIEIVRQLVGHSTTAMTQLYFHHNLEDCRRAIALLPNFRRAESMAITA